MFPNFFAGRRGERLSHLKKALQLQMRPAVKRASRQLRHRCRPGLEFFIVIRIAGYVFFRNAVNPHGPPFIMIAAKPDAGNIAVSEIFRNFSGINVTVVIDDRQAPGILLVDAHGSFTAQHKIFSHKSFFHVSSASLQKFFSSIQYFGVNGNAYCRRPRRRRS